MSGRSHPRHDRASMSGEMLAFIAVMGFTVLFFVTNLFFPKAFNFVWYGSLTFISNTFTWLMTGWPAPIVIWGFVLIVTLMKIGVAVLILERIYRFVTRSSSAKKARDDWNDYRVK